MANWFVEVWSFDADRETGKPEHRLGPFSSERTADRADDGFNRNMNHEKFYTLVVPEEKSRAPAARPPQDEQGE